MTEILEMTNKEIVKLQSILTFSIKICLLMENKGQYSVLHSRNDVTNCSIHSFSRALHFTNMYVEIKGHVYT